MIPHSQPWITPEDAAAMQAALTSGFIGQGRRNEEFEQQLGAWVGGTGGVSTASGTAALCLALRSLGCGPGDEVILPTYICRNLLQAVQSMDAIPVLCDSGPDWLVEPANVASLVTPHTKILLLPHIYGLFADIAAFRSFGVPIIEDCAQAIDVRGGHPIAGDLAVFSFHPTKCLTTGEGGMVVARDAARLDRLRALRDDIAAGSARRVFAPLSDLAAALGLSQLARYEKGLRRRRAQAAAYAQALEGIDIVDFNWYGRRDAMFYRFPLRIAGGLEYVATAMQAQEVTVRRGVNELLHRLLGRADAEFPQAMRHFQETVSVPIYPALTEANLARCLDAVRKVFTALN